MDVISKRHTDGLTWKFPRIHWTAVLFYPLAKLLISFCNGFQKIPKSGGCIVVANHTSYVDHFVLYTLIAVLARRRAKFVSKVEHFKSPLTAKIISYLGAFPINRARGGRTALAKTVDLVNAGEIVVIYPEGTRSRDGTMQPFKTGVTFVQEKTRAPIVPIGISGAFDIWPAHKKWPRPGRVSINCGTPIYRFSGPEIRDSIANEQHRRADILKEKVSSLL